MGLKDEIDRLIATERERLQERDMNNRQFDELLNKRFLPLRVVLEELIRSVDPTYLRVEFGAEQATIEIGRFTDDCSETNVRWKIEPFYTPNLEAERGEGLFETQPGFSVKELITGSPLCEPLERTYTVATEADFMERLLNRLAENIADYQHLKER